MIQRIQSLLLLFTIIINLGIFFTPLYRHAMNDPSAWVGISFALVLTAAMLIALVSFFLFQDRKKQLFWVKLGVYIQIVAVGMGIGILFSLGGIGLFLWKESVSVMLLLISLVCYWQAGRFIKKDEKLVQSMDRIR